MTVSSHSLTPTPSLPHESTQSTLESPYGSLMVLGYRTSIHYTHTTPYYHEFVYTADALHTDTLYPKPSFHPPKMKRVNNKYSWSSLHSSEAVDVYQWGRIKEKCNEFPVDFIVPGQVKVVGKGVEQKQSLYHKLVHDHPHSRPILVSHHPILVSPHVTVHKSKKTRIKQATWSFPQHARYPFRLVGCKKDKTVRIYAGACDTRGYIALDPNMTWKSKKEQEEEGKDGFVVQGSVLLWKPTSRIWMEVSVLGHVFHVRPCHVTRGDTLVEETNELIHGSIIYANGGLFMWSSECDMECSTSVIQDEAQHWMCPVTLDTIPTREYAQPVPPMRMDGHSVLHSLSLWNMVGWYKGNRSLNMAHQFRVLMKQSLLKERNDSKNSHLLTLRPWFFPCGHVTSCYMLEWDKVHTCPVCRRQGPCRPLISHCHSLIQNTREKGPGFALNCGHILYGSAVDMWCPPKGLQVPLVENQVVQDHVTGYTWGHVCPYCRIPIQSVCKLYIQHDDNVE